MNQRFIFHTIHPTPFSKRIPIPNLQIYRIHIKHAYVYCINERKRERERVRERVGEEKNCTRAANGGLYMEELNGGKKRIKKAR